MPKLYGDVIAHDHESGVGLNPIPDVGGADKARCIHKGMPRLDDHIRCRNDIHDGRHVWVPLGQPQRHRNVVLCTLHQRENLVRKQPALVHIW